MKKRSDKNSVTSSVAGFAGVIDDDILPPAGVELRSDKEHLIWNQFTRARAKEDWPNMDLILLAKIVKMEADIRTAQVEGCGWNDGREQARHTNTKSADLCDRYLGAASAGSDPIYVAEPNGA